MAGDKDQSQPVETRHTGAFVRVSTKMAETSTLRNKSDFGQTMTAHSKRFETPSNRSDDATKVAKHLGPASYRARTPWDQRFCGMPLV